MMRGEAWPLPLFLCVASTVAVLTCLPSAAGQEGGGSLGVLESTYGLDVLVPTGSLEEVYDADTQGLASDLGLPTCGSDHFTMNQTGGWFRFREQQTENGCGEARYTLDIPAGASSMRVRFKADRAILQPSNQAIPLAIDMVQELHIYDQDGSLVEIHPYYQPEDPQHLEAQDFEFDVELQPGQPSVTVGWLFHDRGQEIGQGVFNPLAGHILASTVREATLALEGIPLAPDRIERQRLGLQDDSVRYSTSVMMSVPDTLGVSGRISLALRVAEGLAFSHVLGPRGETVDQDLISSSDVGDVRTVVVSGEATSRHGPGLYQIVFTSSTPIEPAPLLYPFIVAVMAVPAGAGVLALRNTRQFRRQATPEFAGTAANLDHVVLVMLGVYLLLPIGVIVSGRLSLLASWPLEGEAGLVYLLIGLAFVAFLSVGFVGRRHLGTLMVQEQSIQEHARRELERSNRELAEFAYVASHDLQEPLRTVASYTQLLQRRYKGKLDTDADEFIDAAVEGSQRMQLLIQDLLAYSRVGSKPESATAVDLGAVVQDVRLLLRQAITDAKAELVVTNALPTVVGHERQFLQLLQNLVANAIKFRDPARPCRVEVAAEAVPGGHRVTVKDNGIGIDPRHFDRIFQIFQRLHDRDAYPGTGIGLAICKRIVELNGGRIGVESVPGSGSTFWFTVPDRPLPDVGDGPAA